MTCAPVRHSSQIPTELFKLSVTSRTPIPFLRPARAWFHLLCRSPAPSLASPFYRPSHHSAPLQFQFRLLFFPVEASNWGFGSFNQGLVRRGKMKAPSRATVRSVGKLVERYRQCGAVSAPVLHPRNCMGPSQDFGAGKGLLEGGLLRDELQLMQRTLPTSWGRQLQPERGFLGIGDGDEELGMSKHFEQNRVFGYSPEQVFDVVAGVDLYEDFVPWCQKSKVLWRTDDKMDAELEIGFKLFVERYISHVQLKPPNLIKTTVSQSSLFDFLNNEWHFKPGPTPDSCHLFFVVDFRFKSPLYRKVANLFFNEVQAQLVGSFEGRCQAVYGPSMETIMR